jgi:light-regulated signal transduction histidine kinase (bacteriophytochrome)
VEFSFAKVDLNEVVQDVAGRLKSALLENHVELRVPQKLPVTFCDQARIAEVFANLISNSIKYNDQSKKWIEVGFIEKKDQPAQFYVRDNGIGISALHHTRIFKMFERLHSEQEYGGGSGSGLALVKRIIDRHSGKIWVESVPGQGTTFLFTLAPESGR